MNTTQLNLTEEELDNLYFLLTFLLEGLSEDDDRYGPTESVLYKIES